MVEKINILKYLIIAPYRNFNSMLYIRLSLFPSTVEFYCTFTVDLSKFKISKKKAKKKVVSS